MRYRNDIDIDNTWVVSDTHFGHDNIVGFCFRPEDHEQVMIAEWRAAVPDDATVLHLGDVCYGHNGGNTRFKRLTSRELTGGRKLLVKGNHDNQSFNFYRECGFRVIQPFLLGVSPMGEELYVAHPVNLEGGKQIPPQSKWHVSFSHYAAAQDTLSDNEWRVHGHIHNNGYTRDGFVPFVKNHINVSVEQTKYRPVNLGMLLRGALLGVYPETTPEQIAEAQARRRAAMGK